MIRYDKIEAFKANCLNKAVLLLFYLYPFIVSAQWDQSSTDLKYEKSYKLDAIRQNH